LPLIALQPIQSCATLQMIITAATKKPVIFFPTRDMVVAGTAV
jgi:hypothetical protein